MKTVITLTRADGRKADRVEIPYDDATTQAIAQAAMDIITASMSLSEGDAIFITVEK